MRAGAELIADVIQTNRQITKLEVSGAAFGDEGCVAIARILHRTNLRSLELDSCGIGFSYASVLERCG